MKESNLHELFIVFAFIEWDWIDHVCHPPSLTTPWSITYFLLPSIQFSAQNRYSIFQINIGLRNLRRKPQVLLCRFSQLYYTSIGRNNYENGARPCLNPLGDFIDAAGHWEGAHLCTGTVTCPATTEPWADASATSARSRLKCCKRWGCLNYLH